MKDGMNNLYSCMCYNYITMKGMKNVFDRYHEQSHFGDVINEHNDRVTRVGI